MLHATRSAKRLLTAAHPRQGRPPRDDSGFSMIQMVITMIAAVVLGLVAFNVVPGFLGQAETTAVQNNVREVARSFASRTLGETGNDDARIRVASVTASSGDAASTGAPQAAWINALAAEFPGLEFRNTWVAADEDNAGLIRIQFIGANTATGATGLRTRAGIDTNTDATGDAPTGHAAATDAATQRAPEVPWVTNDHSAVRIRARDGDNWACALVTLSSDFGYTAVATDDEIRLADSRVVASGAISPDQASSRVSGIWFDAGDTMDASNGLHHCSPVNDAATDTAELPESGSAWNLDYTAGTTPAYGAGTVTMRRNFE